MGFGDLVPDADDVGVGGGEGVDDGVDDGDTAADASHIDRANPTRGLVAAFSPAGNSTPARTAAMSNTTS